MTEVAIIPDQLLFEGQIVTGMAVVTGSGRITSIVPSSELPPEVPRSVLAGFLTPGFIDIHTHGAFGAAYGEEPMERTERALEKLLLRGITTVMPTMPSMSIKTLSAAIENIAGLPNRNDLPRIPGVHLEGPYFSQAQRGAQIPEVLRLPSDGSLSQILEYSDHIKMMSYAPELDGAIELTKELCAHGIVAAAGHTNGSADDLRAAQEAGLSHVIHIVSGQSVTRREGPWRVPGMLEATLISDDLTVELIADGKHLPPELMKLAYRCLAGRLCLVSDATPGSGLPDGTVYRMGPGEYVVRDGVGMTLDGLAFGGSTTTLDQMLPILHDSISIGTAEAVAMVTEIPAKAAKLTDVGKIAPGYHADFVLLDPQLRVTAVARGGQWQGTDTN